MSHRQNSKISPSSVHIVFIAFGRSHLIVLQGLSTSHEEFYRFAGFWEPEGLPLLAGHHIVLQGKGKTSKCTLGPRLYDIWLYVGYCLLLKSSLIACNFSAPVRTSCATSSKHLARLWTATLRGKGCPFTCEAAASAQYCKIAHSPTHVLSDSDSARSAFRARTITILHATCHLLSRVYSPLWPLLNVALAQAVTTGSRTASQFSVLND